MNPPAKMALSSRPSTGSATASRSRRERVRGPGSGRAASVRGSEARDPPGPALADERERRRAVLLAGLELDPRARPRPGHPHRLHRHVDAVGVADRLVHDGRAPVAARGEAVGERRREEVAADVLVLAVVRRALEVDDGLGGLALRPRELAQLRARAGGGLAAGGEGGARGDGGERGSRRAWRHAGAEGTHPSAGWPTPPPAAPFPPGAPRPRPTSPPAARPSPRSRRPPRGLPR